MNYNKAELNIGQFKAEVLYKVGTLELVSITFDDTLRAEDIRYACDIVVKEGYTIASSDTILRYLDDCLIGGKKLKQKIYERIQT